MFDGSGEGRSVSDGFQLQTALILIGVCNIVDMSTTECVFDFDIDLATSLKRLNGRCPVSIWAPTRENMSSGLVCKRNKGADKPAHRRSLISADVVRLLDSIILYSYFMPVCSHGLVE